MTDDRKNSSAPFWCTLLLGTVLAYPASLGPWVYFVCRFDPPAPLVTAGEVAYQPMEFIVERIMPDPIASLYFRYMDWWQALSGNPIRC
jgi:hypothetical protein